MGTNRWGLVVALVLVPRYAAVAGGDETQVHEVKAGKMNVHIDAWGLLEATRSNAVYCQVAGQTTIISILPEGTKVAKGEVVCELDSSALKDNLTNQEITTRGAEAAYLSAKLTREVAELAVRQYDEGLYKQHLAAARGEIARAESGIKEAEVKLASYRSLLAKLNAILAPRGADRTAPELMAELDLNERLQRAAGAVPREKLALQQAQTKLEVLEGYTKDKTLKELGIEVEKARPGELARQATWELEKSKEAKLRRQIADCMIKAPDDGLMVYPKDLFHSPGTSLGGPVIQQGAIVREGQKIFSLPDISQTQVNTKEATRSQDVRCQVAGQTTIIRIVPEGTAVKKGEVVCELDSSALKDSLTNQVIATKGSEAAYQNAKLTREVAEIAVREYEQGVFKQNLATAEGEIARAESDLKRSEDRLDWSDKMLKKGYISLDQNISEKLALKRAKFALEQAQTKKSVLEVFTKDKTIKELKSEVEKARSGELARQATWELEKGKEAKLRTQIANCELKAPNDGLVVYANDPFHPAGTGLGGPVIEQGAIVRERQKIFSLPDISQMQVSTKVAEAVAAWVRPGQRARVKVEGVEGDSLAGLVLEVAPRPDPTTSLNENAKVYWILVRIEKSPPGLAVGMTAEVEIETEPLERVLTVPLPSVVYYDGTDHVAVKKAGGGWEWRGVSLGRSDGSQAVVTGLKAGEAVAIDPAPLLSGGQKLRISLSLPRPAPLRAKLQALPAEEKAKMKGARPEEREAILRKAGFTDDEVRQLNRLGRQPFDEVRQLNRLGRQPFAPR
jgi:multidrug resistance efflux pump